MIHRLRPLFRPLCSAFLFLSLPLHADQPVPAWIWTKKGASSDGEDAYLRKIFKIDGGEKVLFSATCDNEMTVFLNGKPIADSKDWRMPQSIDITASVIKGDNLIAVKATNRDAGAAAFIAKIVIEKDGRKQGIATDASWKVSATAADGWNTSLTFDEAAWQPAVTIAMAGQGPWSGVVGENTLDAPFVPKAPEATPVSAIKIKEGFKVELLHTVNPATEGSWVASCFDDKGRMIVSDQYGGLFRITPPAIGGKPEDTKIQPITAPIGEAQGLCYAFNALYVVTSAGKYPRGLYRVTDTDKNDRFDKVEPLRLFPNQGGEHGPHGVILSPDGKSLFLVIGNQTPLTDMDVSRVPKHWAEDNLLDQPLIGRGFMREVMAPGGWVAKTDPDGKTWELIHTGFRNPYDIAFNKNGSLFTFDADMEWDFGVPWYRPTRVCEVISGGESGWRSLSKKWPVRWEDSLPPVVDIGPSSPTGITFGYGTKFPADYQNALFIADWTYGKLYAVHLQPDGGSYKAGFEEFMSANPLPLTDISVNPKDGALYFMIGGRKVQSGLYRIIADTSEKEAPVPAAPPLLGLRHQLEEFHAMQDPNAVNFAWPYLGHEDRYIRFAARIAIEHQPVAEWKDRALAEKNPRIALTALMALCRSGEGDKALLAPILAALDRIDFKALKGIDAETYVRDYQLAFSRFGPADDAGRAALIQKISPIFPTKNTWLDVDLAELLVFLGDADFLPKAIGILESAPTQEEQIAYAKILRFAKAGWTPQLRERFFTWVCLSAPKLKGGASFPMYMEDIKRDAIAGLTEDEKAALKPILEAKPEVKAPVFKPNTHGFVKDWTVKDLDPLLAVGLEGGRNFENGRNLFGAAACFACHRFGTDGGAVGPDLSSAAGKFSPRDLLTQIIEPNKEISDQYGQLEVKLDDGSVVYGRTVNLNDSTLVLNTNMADVNALTTIERKRIKSMDQSKTSMMPPGLLNNCTDTDILDLLAYLLSKGDKSNPLFK